MNSMRVVVGAMLVAGAAGCAYLPGSSGGWTTIFDGAGLDAFERVGTANWRVVEGSVVADKGAGFLVTRAEYGDFELRVDFWAESDTNSGIFLRCSNRQTITSALCYEVNIWDLRPAPEYGTGAIVDIAKVAPMPKAGGRWNAFVITAKGEQLVVTLNGVKTVDVRHGKHARGPIALQYAPGVNKEVGQPIKFRKVEIRAL